MKAYRQKGRDNVLSETSSHVPQMVVPSNKRARDDRAYYAIKRAIDIVVSVTLLIILSPLLLLLALLIRLETPGGALFVQERVGARLRDRWRQPVWEVRNFRVYKFRTMVQDADESLHRMHIAALANGNLTPAEGNAPYKLNGDPRVTRVGRVLRKTSLDELPQLINVVKGDMSLVGPRPVPTYEVAHYEPWQFERLAALPGITGLWQVTGRCALPFNEMIQLDLEYVRTRSTMLDLKILVLTIPAVLRGTGAG